jgi:hypothetical protein
MVNFKPPLTSSPFSTYEEEPVVVSPNLGVPKFFTVSECHTGKTAEYDFFMNVICHKDIKPEELMTQLELYAVPLYAHEPSTKKLKRGVPLKITIIEAHKKNSLVLNHEELVDLYHLEQDTRPAFILRHNFFGKDQTIYWVRGHVDLECETENLDWLDKHRFLMCDLYQFFPNLDPAIVRINYHAIVFCNHEFSDFNFVHITDLHIAKRFDELLGVISDRINIEESMRFTKEEPLRKRYKNPNNYLRQFILWANQQFRKGGLDVVFMTGDLIDYCLKTSLPKVKSYELEETNWEIMHRILLYDPIQYRTDAPTTGILSHEEIAVPIFTLPGNHDVRLFGYPINVLGNYHHFGLNLLEASFYKDPFRQRSFRSIKWDKYCLRAYYQFFNPYDDYALKLGNHRMIFLNSGQDSIKAIRSFLMANPSSVGFSKKQIEFTRELAKKMMDTEQNPTVNYLFSHGPVLNPVFRNIFRRKLSELFSRGKADNWLTPEYYKENNLIDKNISAESANIGLEFDYGTIAENRIDIMALMYRYRMIGIHGHTHLPKEFRFVFTDKLVAQSKNGEIEGNPFLVYWEDYTSEFEVNQVMKFRPIDLQTPAMGIGQSNLEQPAGAYRRFEIRNNEIQYMKIEYL